MISVVMPAYNAAEFIAPAIESILSQTYGEFELIVVDDGSTDNTLDVVQGYAEQDDRVQILKTYHRGYTRAINLGISESKYPWIARMDADDISLPERFAVQIDAIKSNPEVVVWSSYVYHINSKGEILSLSRLGATTEAEFHRRQAEAVDVQCYHPTVLFKKEIFMRAGGYNPNFEPAEDFELWDRMAQYGPVLAIPQPLVLYRVHLQSVSMQRFFLQRLYIRYVTARRRERVKNNRELEFDEFFEKQQLLPVWSRLWLKLQTFGTFYYRKGGIHFGERQYLRAGLCLSLSTALNPYYAPPRIWRMKFSSEARRWLH